MRHLATIVMSACALFIEGCGSTPVEADPDLAYQDLKPSYEVIEAATTDELDFPRQPNSDYSVPNLNEYACLRDDMTRILYVEYLGGPGQAPCTVVYEKRPPEPSSRVFLWNAEENARFCEDNARDLVEKLRDWGWKCGLYLDVFGSSE